MKWMALVALISGAAQPAIGDKFAPARVIEGTVPTTPAVALVLGGGEVLLEVTVSRAGLVSNITNLRTTPPFTELVVEAVRKWRFSSAAVTNAKGQTRAVDTRVLVAAIFRPPTLYNNASTQGEPPKDVGSPSTEIPFPTRITMPVYPVRALLDGVVVVETEVAADGSLKDATTVSSGPGFDQVALDAARQWTFRRGLRDGLPTATFAYLIFAFRPPNISSGAGGPGGGTPGPPPPFKRPVNP
jgi:TonB family protein